MGLDKNNTRRIGGVFLEALMLVIIFTFSRPDTKVIDRNPKGILTISAAPAEQLVFFHASSISESFLKVISKIQLANSEFGGLVTDLPTLEIAASMAFLITESFYKTFYTNVTINAP